MEDIELQLIGEPNIHVRTVLPSDSDKEAKDKVKLPFVTCTRSTLIVRTEDETFTILAPNGTKFDGASIPLGLGKGNTKLHVAALFHDLICIDKSLVNYNRNLSSTIYYELLVMHKLPKWRAKAQYYAVDTWQRFQRGWKC